MSTPIQPPRTLLRAVGRAIQDYDMIRPHDRLLLGVSGGKDSLSLLHILRFLRTKSPTPFDLGAATVDPMIEGFNPAPLQEYVPSLGISYVFRKQAIIERARRNMRGHSFCAYCSRMRRGALYDLAREHGYTVLVLAQHLDDLAESFLMSAFQNGHLRTMKAHYRNDAGDLRVIRPLVYVRERQTADFARRARLPVIADNCPACYRRPTQRFLMKSLLARQEQTHNRLFPNLLAAMRPLMGVDLP
jgi:tRNA 2-thiocytidine biosynthesis protein TtcA